MADSGLRVAAYGLDYVYMSEQCCIESIVLMSVFPIQLSSMV